MIDTNLVRKILKERVSYDPNDPSISECWNQMTTLLVENEEEAILFFEQASESEIFFLSELFEMMSERLQSRSLVDSIKKLQDKFPNVDMSVDIKYAEMALRDK